MHRPLKTTWPLNLLLTGWSLVAVALAAAHLLLPIWTAEGTNWLSSPHWQWEIASFDLAAAAAFLWVARQRHIDLKIKTTWLLCCLSLAIGANHLSGWLEKPQLFHVVFTLGNMLAVLCGMLAIGHARVRGRRQAGFMAHESHGPH
jgi:hypothetical protein